MKIGPYDSRNLAASVDGLRGLMSRRKRVYLRSGGAAEDPEGAGRRLWVVSRSLCRFYRIAKAPATTAPKQIEMLKLEVERLSPFESSGSHFHIGPDFICLWVWDLERLRQAAAQIDARAGTPAALPETALLPPQADGWRLTETLEGCEGQHWIGGCLAASRWWPEPPAQRDWLLFQRGAAAAPDEYCEVPPPGARQPWLDKPWTRSAAPLDLGLDRVNPRLAAAATAAALTVAFSYVGAKSLRMAYDVHAIKAQIAARSAAIEPQLEARSAAQAARGQVLALRKLNQYPSQLWLMARVADMLPRNEAHLYEWDFDRGELQFKVTADHPLDTRYFVQSLERVHGFSKVGAERVGSNGVSVHLTVEAL